MGNSPNAFATLFAMVALLGTACNTETPDPSINYVVNGSSSGNTADADTDVDADNDVDTDEPVEDDTGTEEVLVTYYYDADSDGFGNPASSLTTSDAQPAGWVTNSADCDDDDATVHPGGTEVCDTVDNDCNGPVDDNATDAASWVIDFDFDGYGDVGLGDIVESCTQPAGYAANATDCNDTDATVNPGADEVSNDVDDDCNGSVDDVGDWCCEDKDGDGYGGDGDEDGDGVIDDGSMACTYSSSGTCPSGYVVGDGDCDDHNGSVSPGQSIDIAGDGEDDDCDGDPDA